MNIINISVKPPKSLSDTVTKEVDRAKDILKNKNLRKSDKALEKISKDIKKKYELWKKQTKLMRSRLVRYNNMLENVVEQVDFPFEGASNITLGYVSGIARTFKSVFNRAVYQDPDIFSAITKRPEIDKEALAKLEQSNNYYFNTETNGLDILKEGTTPCFRDGTLIISGYWKQKIEKVFDSKIYKQASDFVSDYPSPQDAGISEEEYNNILDSFIVDQETEVHSSYLYDTVVYNNPYWEIIPLARFIHYPTYATSIEDMQIYGSEYFLSKEEIKEKIKWKEFYPDQGNRLLEAIPSQKKDTWSATKNFIEGITRQDSDKNDTPFKLIDCVYKADLDDDGILEKYFVTFSPDHKIILSFRTYDLRNNIDFCVDFRFVGREDRFLGVSLVGENEDKFNLMDTLHQHRNNIRTLVTSPILLADKNKKDELDLFTSESIIRPGTTFWVSDIDHSIKQLALQNLDQPGNSLDEENLIVRYIELSIGPTQALSGRDNPSDPRSPMGKTVALMQQANQRIDDYIDEFRKSIPKLAKLQNALLAQYSDDIIKYSIEQDGRVEFKEIDKSFFTTPGIIWRAKRRSLTLSPEFAMQRLGGLLQIYMQLFPFLQKQDPIAIEIWDRMVVASGEPDKEKLILKLQQMMAQQMQQAQQAQQAQQQGIPGIQGQPQQGSNPPGAEEKVNQIINMLKSRGGSQTR